MWPCAVWQAWMSEGMESPPPAWPIPTTHHHTPADYSNTTSTAQCLQCRNTVAWFYLFLYTVLKRYFYYHHMFLCIFFASLNYTSSLPNASVVNTTIYISIQFQVNDLQKPHDTFRNLKNTQNFQKMITVNVVTWQDGAVQFSDKIPTDLQ